LNGRGKEWFRERLNEVRSLEGYTSGETVRRTARRLGIKSSEIVKLNSNENFFMPKEKLTEFLMEVVEETDLRRYPQEEELLVKRALGKYLSMDPECIIVGNGSDQLIELIASLFLDRGDEVFSVTPTFSMYQHVVSTLGAKYFEVPLKEDFSLNIEEILAAATSRTRLLFLCSPNNPTGNQFREDEIIAVVKGFPGLVVIDEAYAEFAEFSVVPLVNEFENLIVLRTFSKAFGLAGLRFGYAVSQRNLSEMLSIKAQLPYPVNSIALKMGLRLLNNLEIMKAAVNRMKKERERLIKQLDELRGVSVFDSQANFVLVQTNRDVDEVFRELLKRGIIVRKIGKVLTLSGCLRVTVGLPKMNDKLLAILKQICGGEK
jgi:histidinol-phosphate aminotransferase